MSEKGTHQEAFEVDELDDAALDSVAGGLQDENYKCQINNVAGCGVAAEIKR